MNKDAVAVDENTVSTPVTSLFFWLFFATAGYAFVAGGLCHRPNPFASAEGNAYELPKLLLAATVFWALGARHTLVPFSAPWPRALLRNGLCWVLPFFLAFSFHYGSSILKVDFGLTPASFAAMSAYAWLVFGLAAAVIIGLAAYHGRLAWRAGILHWWLGALAAVVLSIAFLTWLWRDTHSVHIHHFFLFGMFVPWLRFQTPLTALCQAVCAGISVEGVATWGMDPTWYPLH